MARIFISYARAALERVTWLEAGLTRMGHEVWFDQDIGGGREWWAEILAQIRDCDVFVAALDQEAVESVACRREMEYASALNLPILPIRLNKALSPATLPGAVAERQLFDLFANDPDRLVDLAGNLARLEPRRDLPDPLPEEPEVPLSYLTALAEQIRGPVAMDEAEQLRVVAELRRGLRAEEDRADAARLLTEFRERGDLLATIAEDVDAELARLGERDVGEQDGADEDDPGGVVDANFDEVADEQSQINEMQVAVIFMVIGLGFFVADFFIYAPGVTGGAFFLAVNVAGFALAYLVYRKSSRLNWFVAANSAATCAIVTRVISLALLGQYGGSILATMILFGILPAFALLIAARFWR